MQTIPRRPFESAGILARPAFLICLFSAAHLPLCLAAEKSAPAAEALIVDHGHSPHAKLQPLPYDAVEWTQGFWADRFRQMCGVTLRESWRLLADPDAGHVLENFRIAGKSATGEFAGTNWQDEWLYKWLEAAACAWRVTKDPWIEDRMNEAIALIAAAQQPDGYISTNIIDRGEKRFQPSKHNNHEAYNMGHLITAGVIHHRMTGKNTLLDAGTKAADYLCENLGTKIAPSFAHNPSAIMGLVEMYRLTGKRKYLDCAQLIVDSRGTKPRKGGLFGEARLGFDGTDNMQDRVPIRRSSEVVGHNVFSTYLYTGASDVQAEIGDPKLESALNRLWDDLVNRKMFITGGISAIPRGLSHYSPVYEATGPAYELPNATSYNETCGQIGCFMWGYRMLTNEPDGRFADTMEREMYNGFLGAIGLDGKSWFYRNILRRYDKNYQPTGWTDMALRGQPGLTDICCPSNLLRTIAEISSYFYGIDSKGLWIHQYGGNRVTWEPAPGQKFVLEQVTDYPWSGKVQFIVREAAGEMVPIHLRIPEWAGKAAISVAGKPLDELKIDKGYAMVSRKWKKGDSMELDLSMTPRLVEGNPNIEATRNQVAVMRGPVVYCLESADLPDDIALPNIYLPEDIEFHLAPGLPHSKEPLARSIVCLKGQALYKPETSEWQGLYRPLAKDSMKPMEITLVPYFAWANRGRSAMSVWLPLAFVSAPVQVSAK